MDTTSTSEPPASPSLDEMVAEWTKIKDWMAVAKEREMVLRTAITAAMFKREPNGAFKEGTSKSMADGSDYNYRGKLVSQWKRELLEEVLEATIKEANLTSEERLACIKTSYELKVGGYKKLPDDKRKIMDKAIVSKQGSITLEVDPVAKS